MPFLWQNENCLLKNEKLSEKNNSDKKKDTNRGSSMKGNALSDFPLTGKLWAYRWVVLFVYYYERFKVTDTRWTSWTKAFKNAHLLGKFVLLFAWKSYTITIIISDLYEHKYAWRSF